MQGHALCQHEGAPGCVRIDSDGAKEFRGIHQEAGEEGYSGSEAASNVGASIRPEVEANDEPCQSLVEILHYA